MTIQRFDNGQRFCRVLSHDGNVVARTEAIPVEIDDDFCLAGSDQPEFRSVSIWLRDLADFDSMNSVEDSRVDPAAMPVRANVTARLAGDADRVEIMVTVAA